MPYFYYTSEDPAKVFTTEVTEKVHENTERIDTFKKNKLLSSLISPSLCVLCGLNRVCL
jgi:hypothetical protein